MEQGNGRFGATTLLKQGDASSRLQSSTTGGLRLSERLARAVQEALQCNNRSDAERCVLTGFEENRRDKEKNSLIIDDPGFVDNVPCAS